MITKATRNTMTFYESKTDICDKKKPSQMIALSLAQLAVPPGCPINSEKVHCLNNKKIFTFSASSQRILASFAITSPVSTLRVNIDHDNGKSCFEGQGKVVKI